MPNPGYLARPATQADCDTGRQLIAAGLSGQVQEAMRVWTWFNRFLQENPRLPDEDVVPSFVGSLLNEERENRPGSTVRGLGTVSRYYDVIVRYRLTREGMAEARARIEAGSLRQGLRITGRAEPPRRAPLELSTPLAINTSVIAFFDQGHTLDVATAAYLMLATGCRPKHANAIVSAAIDEGVVFPGERVLKIRWAQRKVRGPMNGFVEYPLRFSGRPPDGVAERIRTLGTIGRRHPIRLGTPTVDPGVNNAAHMNHVFERAGLLLRGGHLRRRMSTILLPVITSDNEFEAMMDHGRDTAIRHYRLPCEAGSLLLVNQ